LLNKLASVPNYLITIYLKSGTYHQGIRWHSSYDPAWVRNVVEEKAFKTIGQEKIDQIDVMPTAKTTTDLGPVKML
jgi:hypothetical protein